MAIDAPKFLTIPTDRIYKTFAIGGLIIFSLGGYLIFERSQRDDKLDKLYMDKYFDAVKERETDKARLEKNSFDYSLYKAIFEIKYKVNYSFLRTDSILLRNNLHDKLGVGNDLDSFREELVQLNELKYQVDSIGSLIDMNARAKTAIPIMKTYFGSEVLISILVAIVMLSGLFISFFGFGLWFRVEPDGPKSNEGKVDAKE